MWKLAVVVGLVAGGMTPVVAKGIDWEPCPELRGMECATVRVPLDHLKPDGRTVGIAISRLPAEPGRRRGVLLTNPGGPGAPGIGYPRDLQHLLGDVAKQYDVIGIDPRFMGASEPADCGPVRIADVFRSARSRAEFDRAARLAKGFVGRCRDDRLEYAGIRDVARDLDLVRQALGVAKISYYGVSWGADLGVVYSQLFPGRVDRMVVDSVTDVEGSEYRHLATGERAEAAFDEWAAWAAWRDDEYRLGRTGTQVRKTVTRLIEQAARRPVGVGGYRLDGAAMPWVVQLGMGDESERELAARNVRQLLDAAQGKPVTPSAELAGWLRQYFEVDPAVSRFAAASVAFTCNDNGWPRGPAQYWRDVQRTKEREPLFHTTFLPCAYWTQRTAEPELQIGTDVPMLIVQAERDNIPLRWAQELHAKLPKSTLKTVDRRAHGVYEHLRTTVNEYLGS